MPFQYDEQEHQLAAVAAFSDVLDCAIDRQAETPGLDLQRLLNGVRLVQRANGLPQDDELKLISVQTLDGAAYSFPNLTTEMETGTGKTYAYIRTALTLAKRFGLRKYVIVVPSVAIREQANQALASTQPHFATHPEYADVDYSWDIYRSDQPYLVDNFVMPSSTVRFLIMTLAAFNKLEDNRIYRESETLHLFSDHSTGSQMEKLQSVKPILILDEPQNMESDLSKRALATLRPLFALRFSASHENVYNLIYRLGPREARDRGLVKRVAVRGVTPRLDPLGAPVRLLHVELRRRTARATVRVALARTDGSLYEDILRVEPGDDLSELTGRNVYKNYIVDEIRRDRIVWEDPRLPPAVLGHEDAHVVESVWRDQIYHTLRVHFERQRELDLSGYDVKVLSLFFIERVSDYIQGIVPRIFAEEYQRLKVQFPEYTSHPPQAVCAAYFSQTARGRYQDEPRTDEECRQAVDLILRQKERLLSKTERTSFVFSHTALGEGWDNPNIFQICFLRHSQSDIQRRQQVGRGLRLPVDSALQRVFDPHVNRLTLIVNESFETFVEKLNAEYGDAPAREGSIASGSGRHRPDTPPIENDALRVRIVAKEDRRNSPEFAELWNRIRYRSKYRVSLRRADLLEALEFEDWDALEAIEVTRNIVSESELLPTGAGTYATAEQTGLRSVSPRRGQLPDLLALIESHLYDHDPRLTLTRRTIAAALQALPARARATAARSPEQWAAIFATQIRDAASKLMVSHIKYELLPSSEWWDADVVLRRSYEAFAGSDAGRGVVDTSSPSSPSYYSHVDYESAPERQFIEQLESQGSRIKLYVRLPRSFDVPTPVGTFSPDYAIVATRPDDTELVYLVQEIKSSLLEGERRQLENWKIRYARQHFKVAPKPVQFAVTIPERGLRFEEGD